MPRIGPCVGLVAVLSSLAAAACGIGIQGDPAVESADVSASAGDASAEAGARTAPGDPSCGPADAGCAASNGATPSPPPLACTSSRDCPGDNRCCYDSVAGSSCRKTCDGQRVELCVVEAGGCGPNHRCVDANVAIAPTVGMCSSTKD